MTSGLVLLIIGLLLCFAGTRSLRLAISASGFGAAWIVADAFDASSSAALLVGLSGAVVTLAVTLLMSRLLFLLAGGVVGAVVGAELLVLVDQDEHSVILAVFFIPAMAVAFGALANRMRRGFLAWGTAFAGAALVLSGVGLLAPEALGDLHDPDGTAGQLVLTLLWLALALVGRTAQRRATESVGSPR